MKKSLILFIAIGLALIAVAAYFIFMPRPAAYSNQPGQGASQAKTVSEDLTVTGAVSGHMTTGRAGDTYLCSLTATGPIVGSINGQDYSFEYRALTARGPGTYSAYVQIGPVADTAVYYGSDNVSLTIGGDERSGKVNGDLHNLKNQGQTVHISGSWTCPPDF